MHCALSLSGSGEKKIEKGKVFYLKDCLGELRLWSLLLMPRLHLYCIIWGGLIVFYLKVYNKLITIIRKPSLKIMEF